MQKPRLLLMCFSVIERDSRVLKQIRLLQRRFQVTTCGYGPTPVPGVEHLEIDRDEPKPTVWLRAAFIRLHCYRAAYWVTPRVRQAVRLNKGRRYDAVFADDLDTVGAALKIASKSHCRVHADIHEYFPGLHDFDPKWAKLQAPYMRWQLRKFVGKAASLTVVNDATGRRYQEEFGLAYQVVPNVPDAADLHVTPTADDQPLRLVHVGGAMPGRRIEDLMRAAALAEGVTLDLYLVGEGTGYYRQLQQLSDELGPTVQLKPSLPENQVLSTMNQYDVGFHSLPPTNTNHLTTMPNKLYQFIQARLALVVGPTKGMAEVVNQYQVGIVADDFTPQAMAQALQQLTPENVRQFKDNSDRAAPDLVADKFNHIWEDAVSALVTPNADQEKAEK